MIDELERWFVREWEPYYGPDGPGDARRDLLDCCQRGDVPLAVVAFADGVLCGTAALRPDSVSTHPHLTPWLAALLVAPSYREKGVAGRLVEVVESHARDLGFRELFVGSSASDSEERKGGDPSFYVRRGWELVETTPYFVGDAAILRRDL